MRGSTAAPTHTAVALLAVALLLFVASPLAGDFRLAPVATGSSRVDAELGRRAIFRVPGNKRPVNPARLSRVLSAPARVQPSRLLADPLLDGIAVAVVGGANRSDELGASFETWTSVFRHRLFITDEDPEPARLGHGLSATAVNVFAGVPADQQLEVTVHKRAEFWRWYKQGKPPPLGTHSAGWFVSQAKVILGLIALRERHPNADWYVLADSDTHMFPYRLAWALGLLGGHRNASIPLAFGRTYRVSTSDDATNMLLGGAGVVLSRAAMDLLDLETCSRLQIEDKSWNEMASDWRLGFCMKESRLERANVWHLYQSNEHLRCDSAHGPDRHSCNWGMLYHGRVSECPLSLHYVPSDRKRELFAASTATAEVCIPADNTAEANCTCAPRARLPTLDGVAIHTKNPVRRPGEHLKRVHLH